MILLLSSRFLLFLEHLADAAQIVRGRDAEGKLEGTDVCCGILETALAGNFHNHIFIDILSRLSARNSTKFESK